MSKRRRWQQGVSVLCLLGGLAGAGWLCKHSLTQTQPNLVKTPPSHLPKAQATTFLKIFFGEGKDQLSRNSDFDLYMKGPGFAVTGSLSFNEHLNVCLIDFRGALRRFLFFDSMGRLKSFWLPENDKRANPLNLPVALNTDGSVWGPAVMLHTKHDLCYCVRKYDRTGRVVVQFGEPGPRDKPVLPEVKRLLTKRYNHRWGPAYRFGSARIQGLWADRKGRVYVLLGEIPAFYIYGVDGKPLAAARWNDAERYAAHALFPKSLGDLGAVMYVDCEGRIYTREQTLDKDQRAVTEHRLKVWQWENGVREVFSTQVPEAGYVVGVDAKNNIYYSSSTMNYFNERVYKISPDRQVRLLFEPKKFYEKWMEAERKIWLARQPAAEKAVILQRLTKGWAIGPRVGHTAHVDKNGNLYVVLVGASDFRIDKVRPAPAR